MKDVRKIAVEIKSFRSASEIKDLEEAGLVLIEDKIIRLFTFDSNQEEIIQWIP